MKFQPLVKSLAMFVLVHNIRPIFSFMGKNRKSLGGQWGESMMTTMMAEYNTGKHMKGNKKMKKSNFCPSSPTSHSDSSFYASREIKNEPLYKPKTPNQELYLRFLTDKSVKIVLGVGPAGCGKTLFACHRAIEELRSGNIHKIVVTRPMVAVEDESVGFLPGDMNQKMAPWTRPIFDIFGEYYDVEDLNEMVRKGVIEISPLAYMRGRTFKSAFIIADEMQNSTPNQMLMVTTRLGQDSKMVITGDLNQSDRGLSNNGLLDFMNKLRRYSSSVFEKENETEVPEVFEEKMDLMFSNKIRDHHEVYTVNKWEPKNKLGIKLVQLENEDICRSDIVSRVLDIYHVGEEKETFRPIPYKKKEYVKSASNNSLKIVPESNYSKNALYLGMDAPEYLLTKELSNIYHSENHTENHINSEEEVKKENKKEEKKEDKKHGYFTRNSIKNQDAAMIPRRDEDVFKNRCNMF